LDERQPDLVSTLKDNGYNTIVTGDFSIPKTDSYNSQVLFENYDEKIERFNLKYYNGELFGLVDGKPTFLFIYNSDLHYPYMSFDPLTVINHPQKPDHFPNNKPEFNAMADQVLIDDYPDVLKVPIMQKFIRKNGSTKGIYNYFQYLCSDADIEIRLINFSQCYLAMEQTLEEYLDRNNPEHIDFIKYLYRERLKKVDIEIGSIVDDLKKDNLWNKTVFVIRSDHGEEFMEHGKLNHWNNLYEEVVRVPLWIHIPNKNSNFVENITQTIDEAPTLLRALGIDPHLLMQGRDLFGSNNNNEQTGSVILQKFFGLIFSIRNGNYKLIAIHDDVVDSDNVFYELYNLEDDPGEKNNIIKDNEDIKQRLIAKYYSLINQSPVFKPRSTLFDKLTEQQKKNMYENGYF